MPCSQCAHYLRCADAGFTYSTATGCAFTPIRWVRP